MKRIDYIVITDQDLSKIYQCKRCEEKFEKHRNFMQHFYRVHKENKIKCDFCDELFPFRSGLDQHIKIYHSLKAKILKCEKCSTIFYKEISLEIHSWNCGKTNEVKCKICDTICKSPLPHVSQGEKNQM